MSESKFQFRNRNQNCYSGKPKHRYFDEIGIQFCRNIDFVESKQTTFVETLILGRIMRLITIGKFRLKVILIAEL
jgi:hypothetical protein